MTHEQLSANARKKCREIMTQNVTIAAPDLSLKEVAGMLRDGDVGSLPVVENDKLIGIVTDRDIVVRGIAEGKSNETKISELMTAEVFSVKPDDYVFEAIRMMGDRQVRRIPVCEESGALAGIISMADVALETEDQREIAETLEEISSGKGFWKKEK